MFFLFPSCRDKAGHFYACLPLCTHRKLVDTTLYETCRLITGCIRPTATPDLYVLSGIAPPEIRRSIHCQNERTKQLTDQRHSLHHHQPVKSRLHSRNSFVSTSQPLLCKPAEVRVTKWEATQSNLKKYDIHPKEQVPSGDTLPWRTWRTANRVRSGQAATPAAEHLWGYRENKHCMCGATTCDLNHIVTSCTNFGETSSKDDIAEMEGRAVRWMRAVADTIWWWLLFSFTALCCLALSILLLLSQVNLMSNHLSCGFLQHPSFSPVISCLSFSSRLQPFHPALLLCLLNKPQFQLLLFVLSFSPISTPAILLIQLFCQLIFIIQLVFIVADFTLWTPCTKAWHSWQ